MMRATGRTSGRVRRFLPWIAFVLAVAGALAAVLPPGRVRGFDLEAFAHVPVLEGGRVKPLDSVARNALLMIRGRQSFRHEGRTVGADEWLADVLFRPRVADGQKVFFVDDPEVLGLLGRKQSADRYLAFDEIAPHLDAVQQQANLAMALDAKQRSRFQAAVANLFERLSLYYRLRNTVQLAGTAGLGAEILSRGAPGAAERHRILSELAFFRPLPPLAGASPDAWKSVSEALAAPGPVHPALEPLARVGIAYVAGDPASFDRNVAALGATLENARPDALRHAEHEIAFNRAQPFYTGIVIYVLAMLVLFASWLRWPQVLQPTAFALLLAGAVVHTGGLAWRVVLQGRPPVTNLYSSAVFVGWGAVILGIVLERMYRRGFATAVAAASGFCSLIVAHHLTGDGDTMEMMRAVLDSNFWLATHVITITIGYSGTFLAGAIAIGWTLRRHVTRKPDPATSRTLTSMAYGVICFALFFSFVGTVLGGIWADQSWGRFWGWDPKENGALLIVLWNAVILHARWGGYARERGIMAMAIFGNVITSLSWFGVNMLGVGLHSYGFMDKAFWALAGFIGSQLVIMGLAMLPARFWSRSEVPVPAPAKRGGEGDAVQPG